MGALDVRRIRTRYLVLTGLRWLPTGLLIPIIVLLPLDRGLTLAELGLVAAAQGLLVLLLELPTGGLADSLGRRPVLIAGCVVNLASLSLLLVADSPATFLGVYVLQGVYRALDSGPLEAWYVDAALAADPKADIERGLSASSTVLGIAISAGALLSGGIVALDPVPGVAALTTPVLVGIVLRIIELVAIAVLLVEVRPDQGRRRLGASTRAVPSVIADAMRLLRRNPVLAAVVAVELFWGFGMMTFETLTPPRLAEVSGGPQAAAAIMGPVWSGAWLASALGAAVAGVASRRLSVPLMAAALRIVQGAAVAGMALSGGPAGVIVGFLICYVAHGAANPLHMSLIHRQVDSPGYRTTVISINSMLSQAAGALGLVVLGGLAAATRISTAMLVGAVVLAIAAPLYLPARRRRRSDEIQPSQEPRKPSTV